VPVAPGELERLGLLQFPFVIGGITVVANLPGIGPGQLRLTGPVLADIYLGRIRNWDDPAMAALNPAASLPTAPITVIHRSDGSGATFHFARFLGRHSPAWQSEVGQDLVLRWPAGIGAEGNQGLAEAVQRTPNAIGYVDFAQARRLNLSYALIGNAHGAFVPPGPDSFQAAAADAAWQAGQDLDLQAADAPAAYPIVTASFALMPRRGADPARQRATLAFFHWALDEGASAADALGYVALPPTLVAKVAGYWSEQGLR
jgi:phosphate transport system substrate-binding protein